MDGLKRYVNDDRFRVDGDKNMRLLAFTFTIIFVWTGPEPCIQRSSAVYPCSVSVFSKAIRLRETSLQSLNKGYNPLRYIC